MCNTVVFKFPSSRGRSIKASIEGREVRQTLMRPVRRRGFTAANDPLAYLTGLRKLPARAEKDLVFQPNHKSPSNVTIAWLDTKPNCHCFDSPAAVSRDALSKRVAIALLHLLTQTAPSGRWLLRCLPCRSAIVVTVCVTSKKPAGKCRTTSAHGSRCYTRLAAATLASVGSEVKTWGSLCCQRRCNRHSVEQSSRPDS